MNEAANQTTDQKKARKPRRDSRYVLLRLHENDPRAADSPEFTPGIAHDAGQRFKTPKQAWKWAEENQIQGILALACIREVRDCNVRQLWLGKRLPTG